jgi:MFS family permease
MYSVDMTAVTGTRRLASRRFMVHPTVWYLGLTSLFTDISSEMVASALPVYLVIQLGLTPLQFGIIDGLYHGTSALVRLLSGFVSDRWKQYKGVASGGYCMSAVCRIALLFAGSVWPLIACIIAVDRTGKGIRTAPRDALIRINSDEAMLGTSFGVHRTLDAAGAMLGPLCAFALLMLLPGAFDALFVTSFGLALIGFWIILIFVRNPPKAKSELTHRHTWLDATRRLVADSRFRSIVLASILLSLMTVSDSFLYLTLFRRNDLAVGSFPLFAFGTAAFFMAGSLPAGVMADRYGRARVFLAGHAILACAYVASLAAAPGVGGIVLVLALLGLYYAATDGVLAAMTAATVPADVSATGLAAVTTGIAICRLLASVLYGWGAQAFGERGALIAFTVSLAMAIATAAVLLKFPTRGEMHA